MLSAEVGMSWDQSSFYLALRSGTCQGTVMVFDNDALPLTRWLLFSHTPRKQTLSGMFHHNSLILVSGTRL